MNTQFYEFVFRIFLWRCNECRIEVVWVATDKRPDWFRGCEELVLLFEAVQNIIDCRRCTLVFL